MTIKPARSGDTTSGASGAILVETENLGKNGCRYALLATPIFSLQRSSDMPCQNRVVHLHRDSSSYNQPTRLALASSSFQPCESVISLLHSLSPPPRMRGTATQVQIIVVVLSTISEITPPRSRNTYTTGVFRAATPTICFSNVLVEPMG